MNNQFVFLGEPQNLPEIALSYSKENPDFHYQVEVKTSISAVIKIYSHPPEEIQSEAGVSYWDGTVHLLRKTPDRPSPSVCRVTVQKSPARTILRIAMTEGKWTQIEKQVTAFIEHLRRDGWIEDVQTPSPAEPAPVSIVQSKETRREPTEHDRIRTTLMTWAKVSGKCPSYAHAAAQLGIDMDTRRNHERDGWLYSDKEIQAKGGYDDLWKLYTTELRKT